MEVLKQSQYRPISVENQILILYALSNKYMEDIENKYIRRFQNDLIHYIDENAEHIKEEIKKSGKISKELAQNIDKMIIEVKENCSYI
jgi:F-type H+-transporting ATPase subunit alpha